MQIIYTPHFRRSFKKLSKNIQRKFGKQINYLIKDAAHPSLRVKKYSQAEQIWQARIDNNFRFYFLMKKNVCVLLEIKAHPK